MSDLDKDRRRRTVLSLEQALSMSWATLRFVHLGWRVIRVEPTPVPGRKSKGDPNRYVGREIAGKDRHSYYVGPNVGKEAIALDLKQPEGQALLQRLVRELPVDVFCTNTLPAHHQSLGIDYEALRRTREEVIWCAISALGTAYPDVPGYDPVIQAMCGFMDLTGHADGPPLLCGPPIVDLKAGDEAFTQVVLALLERVETGRGKRIDVSMAQCAASWLLTFLPMLDMGSPPSELKRSGNEHRQFIPVNAYATADGFIYLAIGGDAQWSRFVSQGMFASLAQERFSTNEGRRRDKVELHRMIGELTRQHLAEEVARVLAAATIPNAPITPIEKISDLPFVAKEMLHTVTPDGRTVRLPPPAVPTAWLAEQQGALRFAPRYGEHTDVLLAEVGLSGAEIATLRAKGAVA